MRICTIVCLLILLPSALQAIEPEDSIRALAGKDWTITRDHHSLTLTRSKVRVLSLTSLPGVQDPEELWKEFSIESDYRITISTGTKLSEKEYDALKQVRDQLIAERLKGLNRKLRETGEKSADAQRILRLPQYYNENHTLTIYSSWEGPFEIRPTTTQETLKSIHTILDKTYQKYEQPPAKQPN